jgi:hypothetical protein
MTLDDVRAASEGEVTMDLYNHPDTIQARFVDAVYDTEFRDSVLGLFTPLGFTDRSLLVYAMDYCEGDADIPDDWEPAPGLTAADVEEVVAAIEQVADEFLCPHL